MGSTRFRKSKKLAPGLKLNVGKESVGISIGGKLGGVSVNSKGDVTKRASAPGTGLSYVEREPKKGEKASRSKQTKFCGQCGTMMDSGARFCPNCGHPSGR